jgi:hypothetical protein
VTAIDDGAPSTTRLLACALAAAALVFAPASRAAHPLQTEDTGTQGTGNVEIENGLQYTRAGGGTTFLYQPQVSVGVTTTIDAIVQPAWTRVETGGPQGQVAAGLGDTNVDFKWRFLGVDPWSLAVRAGLELPTAQHGLGLPANELAAHALLAMTWDATPTTMHVNVGMDHDPSFSRTTTALVSAAVMQALGERFIVTADTTVAQSPDATRHGWPGTILGGAIWTLRPGLDLDAGWQTSFHLAPVARTWLAGLTWRFAP